MCLKILRAATDLGELRSRTENVCARLENVGELEDDEEQKGTG